uniref:Lysophospholipid acyltransferase 5 n=1 Tax=Ascaris suum TaxID=6253 RepID=F1L2G8_ASCSU
MGLVGALSELLSTREDGLRLLISILAGYPLAAFYRTFVYNKSVTVQHVYFVVVGIVLYLFNYGWAIYHILLSILFAYLITNHLAGTTYSVALAHLAFLGHLLVGYWFAESDQYDITWTTPFCIMTLRFIGLVMDVYDGQKPKDKLKPDQMKTAIVHPPGLLEIAAYGLFFSGTFVGPQFPLARFRAFVNGEFLENGQVRVTGLMPSLGRFVAGCFYAVIHQWGAMWIPSEYFNTREFFALPFVWKLIWIVIWFRLIMSRYVFCWLYTEGAAILSGIAYNGKDENGSDRWDGVRDVHILRYEFGMDFQSVIDSFNVGTNTFAKNHIFKRLRWLGNRNLSHIITLIYLAVWHGYHLGYFVLFAFEFACMLAQEQLYELVAQTPGASEFFAQRWLYPLKVIIGRIIINVAMGTGFLSFGLVKTRIWIKPLLSIYFFAHIIAMIVWPIVYTFLKRILPRKKFGKEGKMAKKVD